MKNKSSLWHAVFSLLFVGGILLGAVLNASMLLLPLEHLWSGVNSFSGFVSEVGGAYVTGFFGKEHFINLNGAFVRACGRKSYNGVSVLRNGMLDHEALPLLDMHDLGEQIIGLERALKEKNIPFLYVQIPAKVDLGDTLILPGTVNCANRNADRLLSLLEDGNVCFLDLRRDLCKDVSCLERHYYRTDHHWNADGAFLATKLVLKKTEACLHRPLSSAALESSRWERSVYPSWFLGSHGKRVGKYFGGVDDLIVYTPCFDTDMQIEIPIHQIYKAGTFDKTVLYEEYLDEPDYFNENPHCVYIGGDYPTVTHRNEKALNDLHVLLIKDSFALPVQAFLSTAVTRLDVIDPRYYREGSVEEYIARQSPDVVIMMINPSVFCDTSYSHLLG